MKLDFEVGKGGVGKTLIAVAVAIALNRRGKKCTIVDYDGGHNVLDTLRCDEERFIPNLVYHDIVESLGFVLIDEPEVVWIEEAKERGWSFDRYFSQFPEDLGLVPFADLTNSFFGVPADTHTPTMFLNLLLMLAQLEAAGYEHAVIDVEPTAGLERLLREVEKTQRSLVNLQKKGILALTFARANWPEIEKYLRTPYIKNVDVYMSRLLQTVDRIRNASFSLVAIPERAPAKQTFKVRSLTEGFGATVGKCIVNNVRGEVQEGAAIKKLREHGLPLVRISRDQRLHSDISQQVRLDILASIGETVLRAPT